MNLLAEFVIILVWILICSSVGYVIIVVNEKRHLKNGVAMIYSETVTSEYMDTLTSQAFTFDGLNLAVGDEVSILLKDGNTVKGTLLGVRNHELICVLSVTDRLIETSQKDILGLKLTSKYGRF